MCHPIRLQDWTTARGNLSGTIVLQQANEYSDLRGYLDVAVYVDVADFGGGAALDVETSPTHDEAFFRVMTGAQFIIAAEGLQTPVIVRSTERLPLARWVRWRAFGTTAGWGLTFRVWLVGNPATSALPSSSWLPDSPRHATGVARAPGPQPTPQPRSIVLGGSSDDQRRVGGAIGPTARTKDYRTRRGETP